MNDGGDGKSSSGILRPGFTAGLLGGVAMALWMVASAAVAEVDLLAPLELFGDAFAGEEGRERGAGRLLYGLGLHLAFAGILGVLFTAVLPRDFPVGMAVFMCVGFALVVMGFTTSLILPAVNPSMRERMPALGGSWVLAHAAYGATVGYAGQRLRQRASSRAAARVPARA